MSGSCQRVEGERGLQERVASLSQLLAQLDEHAAKLATERARVAAELAKLLAKVNLHAPKAGALPVAEPPPAARAKAEGARLKDARGKCAAMCVEEIDRVASLWSAAVSCVALGASCALLLFDGAPPEWTSQFAAQCPQLAEQLSRRTAAMAPAVFASIGSEDRFYVRYADGKQEWIASSECTADVKAKPVAQVSFGRDWDDYVIVYRDGSLKWTGAPPKLAAKLKALSLGSPSVAHVCMGPEGEWFVAFLDGTWEMGGCSDALADKVADVLKGGNAIRSITFGARDSWLIRYTKPQPRKPPQ